MILPIPSWPWQAYTTNLHNLCVRSQAEPLIRNCFIFCRISISVFYYIVFMPQAQGKKNYWRKKLDCRIVPPNVTRYR